jgi:GTP-binding protein
VSFRREKYVPRGGPDGGDGGRGGNVVLVADDNLETLLDFRIRREVRAQDGEPGRGANCHGANGADVELRVPVGTQVFELGDGEPTPICDLDAHAARLVVARGGRGGHGNARFATPTRQAPDFAIPGRAGEARRLRLELKLLADVGLIGLPNAGKSTLVSRISAARPRVAAYPFTTLVPSLGVVELDDRRFVVADIPGLIEGASRGAGLGDRFLRHVERTRLLVHLLDLGRHELEGADLCRDYETVRTELAIYDPKLSAQPEIVVLSKLDLVTDRASLAPLLDHFRALGRDVFCISAATGEGVPALVRAMLSALDQSRARAAEASA